MSAKKDPLPRVIYQIATQRKQSHIYNFFLRLKEHEVNKVPIFTRLNSFKVILKKIQLAHQPEEYVELEKAQFDQRKYCI
jgi:hypothetical protein